MEEHPHRDHVAAAAMAGDGGGTDRDQRVDDDRLSRLPEDVLLDILQRLVTAGDVYTAARTCVLSRRWNRLPRYQIPVVSLDVGTFYPEDGWCPAAPRRRKVERCQAYQQHATAGLTGALWSFLAAPPSARVIETLRLKMILTRHDMVRRIGALVGRAARTGRVKSVELEILTEMENLSVEEARSRALAVSYGERFARLLRCRRSAFASLTRLALENLWFKDDPDAVNGILRGGAALEHLSLRFCGFVPATPLVVDAPPESQLRTLLCIRCCVPGVVLLRAPSVVEFHCAWRRIVDDEPDAAAPPASFGCTPSLKKLTLHYEQHLDEHVQWKLSDFLLVTPRQLEVLTLSFGATKIWVQQEPPKYLRNVFGMLKELHLDDVHPTCDLSWAIFLLEAAPLLELLQINIFNHACDPKWHKKLSDPEPETEPDAAAAWQGPTPGFRHDHLKEVSIRRAFHVAGDLPFARMVMEMAVNLERLALGVAQEDMAAGRWCEGCDAAVRRRPELARRDDAAAPVEKIRDGISTSARIAVYHSAA